MTRIWSATILVVLLVAAALAGGWWAGRHSIAGAPALAESAHPAEDDQAAADQEPAAPPIEITTDQLTTGRLTHSLVMYGTAQIPQEALRDATVPVDVRIVRLLVIAGQQVEQGAPLAEVEPTVDVLAQADEAKHQADAADEDVTAVEQRRGMHLATTQEVTQAHHAALLAHARADVLMKRTAPTARQVQAPVAGLVNTILVHAGQTVSSGATVVTLALPGQLVVPLGLDPTMAPQVLVGQSVRLSSGIAGAESWEAAITSIAANVDPATHLVDALVPLAADKALRAGQVLRGDLVLTSPPGLLVPRAAVRRADGGTALFQVKGAVVVRQVVQVLGENDRSALISGDGVTADMVVATSAVRALEDGQAVTVVNPAPAGDVPLDVPAAPAAPAAEER